MSLVRSLTKRTKEHFAPSRHRPSEPIQRSKISLPIALISSTNSQIYHAMDIADMQAAMASDAASSSSDSSVRSSTDADSVAACSTLASSVESSPIHESPNPLAYYFPDSPTPSSKASPVVKSEQLDAPALPKRALSHSKREHVRLARQRSVRSSTQSTSSSGSESTAIDPSHPFSRELDQLNQIAEEFGLVTNETINDDDAREMQSKGLMKFSAEEYMAEIECLMVGAFGEGNFSGWF